MEPITSRIGVLIAKTRTDPSTSVTFYLIHVRCTHTATDVLEYDAERRYNEFYSLHKSLLAKHTAAAEASSSKNDPHLLPKSIVNFPFPSKSAFDFTSSLAETLATRQHSFEAYLQLLVDLPVMPAAVAAFLSLTSSRVYPSSKRRVLDGVRGGFDLLGASDHAADHSGGGEEGAGGEGDGDGDGVESKLDGRTEAAGGSNEDGTGKANKKRRLPKFGGSLPPIGLLLFCFFFCKTFAFLASRTTAISSYPLACLFVTSAPEGYEQLTLPRPSLATNVVAFFPFLAKTLLVEGGPAMLAKHTAASAVVAMWGATAAKVLGDVLTKIQKKKA